MAAVEKDISCETDIDHTDDDDDDDIMTVMGIAMVLVDQ